MMENKLEHINKYRKLMAVGIALVVVLAVLIADAKHIFAEAAYEVAQYDYHAVVGKDHSYKVTENITINTPSNTEEVRFAIPGGNFMLSGIEVSGVDFTTEKRDAEQYIVIKNVKKGENTFNISYNIYEYADRDDSSDMFYMDLLLPSWQQPITAVDISVEFPDDFPWEDMQYYAGQFGVQDVNTKLDYNADKASHTVTIRGDRIPENFGITLKDQLPNGYWKGMLDGSWAANIMILIAAGVLVILALLWLIGGRDPRAARLKQTKPIEGITPVEVGYIFIERVRIRDILAIIIDLAIKGYIRISEYQPRKYRLIRAATPTDEEKYIRNAYEILFEEVPEERSIDMKDLGPRLARIKRSITEDIAAGFSSKDMRAYTTLSKIFRAIGIIFVSVLCGITYTLGYIYNYATPNFVLAIAVVLIEGFILTYLCRFFDRYFHSDQKQYIIGFVLIAIISAGIPVYVAVNNIILTGQWIIVAGTLTITLLTIVILINMRARAKGNAALTNRFRALRRHIYHPDAKDIAENHFEDRNYYYSIVPYAMLFNGLETWAISFTSLDIPAPDWYSDDIEGSAISNLRTEQETVVDYARDIKTFARTIEDAYHSMDRYYKER